MKTPQERAKELYQFIDKHWAYNESIMEKRVAYLKGREEERAEWEEKTRWIPIEKELPTENKQYLVIQLNDMKRISVGTFNINSKQFSLFGYHDHITHWKEII